MNFAKKKREAAIAKGQILFCQKLLGREEFTGFCERLRESEGYQFFADHHWPVDDGGVVVPVSGEDPFPGFLMDYPFGAFMVVVRSYIGSDGGDFSLAKVVETASDLGRCGYKCFQTHVTLRDGGWGFCFKLWWTLEGSECALESAEVTFEPSPWNPRTRWQYDHQNICYGLPTGFWKGIVKEKFPFLSDLRIRERNCEASIAKESLPLFKSLFFGWCSDPVNREKLSGTLQFCLKKARHAIMPPGGYTARHVTDEQWDLELVRSIVGRIGGREYILDFMGMYFSLALTGLDCSQAYHEWLGRLVMLDTPSGRAINFPLGMFWYKKRKRLRYLYGFFTRDGVAIGFWLPDSPALKEAPVELEGLLPGEKWEPGVPPGGDSFPFPVHGLSESEQLPEGADDKAAVRFLGTEAAKWKRRTPIRPGSLEEQLQKLEKLGVGLLYGDIEDVLEFRERKWFEENPYLGLLLWAGSASYRKPGFSPFGSKINHVDYSYRDPSVPVYELLLRFNLSGLTSVDRNGICSEANENNPRNVVEFVEVRTGEVRRHRWEMESPLDWVTQEFLARHDEVMKSRPGAWKERLYSLPLGDGTFLFATFNDDTARKWNSVLPSPFFPFELISNELQ